MRKLMFLLLCLLLSGCQTAAAGQGYFKAQDLPKIINNAANSVEQGFDVSKYLSEVTREGNRAAVDFLPPAFPHKGLSFSLEDVGRDDSSNTLAFTMRLEQNGNQPQGELVLACLLMVVHATSPTRQDELAYEIEDILKDGKVVVINGWQYSAVADEDSDPMVLVFRARKLED